MGFSKKIIFFMKYILNNNILKLDFGLGKENINEDFRIISNLPDLCKNYDWLIFTDSKGSSINNDIDTWTDSIINFWDLNHNSYLFICRPKEMTILFTLVNFLNNNKIQFKKLLTNVGFVDTTPKKHEFIKDIFAQNPFYSKVLKKYKVCKYLLNSGLKVMLYSVDYVAVSYEISIVIDKCFEKIYFIETFEFSYEIKIERTRPIEFFKQLLEANKLIKLICNYSEKFKIINVNYDIPNNECILSFDAVHFTKEGNIKMFTDCMKQIEF